MEASGVTRVQDDLQVRVLVNRIIDPERTRPVVVITTGSRAPREQLSPDRIADGIGGGVEVAVVGTGRLTYTLRDGLPDDTDVFGDAARTYPVGSAWSARPELAPRRYALKGTDLHRLEQQVIADARSALRASVVSIPDHVATPVVTRPGSRGERVVATPATLPGAPSMRTAPAEARPTEGVRAGPTPPGAREAAPTITEAPVSARAVAAGSRVAGPTPARPFGPPRRSTPTTGIQVPASPSPTAGRTRPVAAADPSRLNHAELWHAQTEAEGRALARHLISEARTHPVLVLSTPSEGAAPLLDAADLQRRVGEIADVVVLHTGPASWALAEGVPPRTQVYGGAGRVYPVDRGWLTDPYRAPLRFCWPADVPARVADTLEDDAYAAATLDGSLTRAEPASAATRPATGKVDGLLDRHNALLRLQDSTQAIVVVDELVPGIEPSRLLQSGMRLSGRVVTGGMFGRFLPDPIDDDPTSRLAETYQSGDLVLARITQVGPRAASGLLHPRVEVSIGTAEEDVDLRSLLEADDVVTLELTDGPPWQAVLAHSESPSVHTPPVLPGGPPWLTEADLPQPSPAADPEPEPVPQPPSPQPSAHQALESNAAPGVPPADDEFGEVVSPTPGNAGLHSQLLGLQAQRDDLSARLQHSEVEAEAQRGAARAAREDLKKLRRQLRSSRDQFQAFKAQTEGAELFDDPAAQLAHDVYLAWLRRTPPSERASWPLRTWTTGPRFLATLDALEGISRAKVVDVLVDVITGRVKEVPGRDLHRLREGSTGPQKVRHDGALAWRCALQINSPSARRMHYWVLADNSVELDQVGVHDDAIVA